MDLKRPYVINTTDKYGLPSPAEKIKICYRRNKRNKISSFTLYHPRMPLAFDGDKGYYRLETYTGGNVQSVVELEVE